MANIQGNVALRQDLNTVVLEAAAASSMFIADMVAPPYEVPGKDGQYPKFFKPDGQLLTSLATTRQANGSYNEVERFYRPQTYSTIDYGLQEAVDDVYLEYVDRYYNAEVLAAEMTLMNLRIARELRVKSALYNTANFTAVSAVVSYASANYATIDFMQDVQKAQVALNAVGETPNTIVISAPLANLVKRSILFQTFIKGYGLPITGAIPLDSTILAACRDMGIEKICFGRLGYQTLNSRTTYTGANIWPNSYIWVGNTQGGDPRMGGAMRTFVWNKEGGLYVTESWREEPRRSSIVRVRQNVVEAVIAPAAGYLIDTGNPTL